MKNNYKLTLAYEGTNYSGWQIQNNALSIQSLVQKAILTAIYEEVNLIASGRTDAGVHAKGQVANFKCNQKLDLYRFLGALNGILPRDIRVLNAEEVPFSFHAQHDALSKIYHYHLTLDPIQSPFVRLHSVVVRQKIDLALLKEAAALFVGTHDFTSFSNEAHKGSAAKGAIRTLKRLDVIEQEDGMRLEFQADGFLYKMVRNIVGTLLEVASHKRCIEDIPLIFSALDRKKAGQAAPAHGLFLMQVLYPALTSLQSSNNVKPHVK